MPEVNVIQRPELMLKLAQRLGLRQAHISPTLNEGVQPVVILDDFSSELVDVERLPQPSMIGASLGPSAIANPWLGIYNRTAPELASIAERQRPPVQDVALRAIRTDNLQTGTGGTTGLSVVGLEKTRFAGNPPVGGSGNVSWMDPRKSSASSSVIHPCEYRLNASSFIPALELTLALYVVGADRTEYLTFPDGTIIPPGWTLWVFGANLNMDWDTWVYMDAVSRET